MKPFIPGIALLYILLPSCRVTEKNIAGIYQPLNGQRTRIELRPDHSFELALLHPGTDTLLFPHRDPVNCFTRGTWEYDNKTIVLKSRIDPVLQPSAAIDDSITRFTNISSFNFWTRYGDPVSIRSISLPPSQPKPHYGNSLYFFAQDFKETDTLKFYFDGFPPFSFPGSIPSSIGNNIHKIVLHEPYHPAPLPDLHFRVKRNELVFTRNKIRFKKNKPV